MLLEIVSTVQDCTFIGVIRQLKKIRNIFGLVEALTEEYTKNIVFFLLHFYLKMSRGGLWV